MAEYDSILLIIKAVIGAIVVIAVTVYVLRPLVKGLSGMENQIEKSRPAMGRPVQEEELEIPTPLSTEVSQRRIIKKALEDPLKTTQLVRNWLRDKK
jgi:flagellar biosynthesis/type III secretory pathway M-ring protein FliF/YscJ